MTAARPPLLAPGGTLAFLSPCGWGNLGDAAIVASLVQAARRRSPASRLVGFTLNPEDTRARHGVEAHTLLGFSRSHYGVREAPAPAASGGAAAPAPAAESRARAAARALLAPVRAPLREALHLRRSRRRVDGASLVVVAGGGQLDETFGGPLGHPYALARWGVLARAAGAGFAFLSVGTGTLGSAASRLFVRRALALAAYRSFRDERSRELAGAPSLTAADPVVPDLAYGLPVAPAPPPGGSRLVVGISPMAYGHPEHWPSRDQERYRRHVQGFGELAARLLRDGHQVVLFTTDMDPPAVRDVTAAASQGLPAEARARLRAATTPTVEELFEVLAGTDLVVAARLHGVLLAHMAHRPVLAVSHERKVKTLMDGMGQERFCLDIAGFDAAQAHARLDLLASRRGEEGRAVAAAVAAFRARVEAQYDLLLGPAPSTG